MKKNSIRHLIICFFLFIVVYPTNIHAAFKNSSIVDSVLVERLLQQCSEKNTISAAVISFARAFIGTPYVGHTLDRTDDERLVVNLRELDCTTYVETVLALARCQQLRTYHFSDYVNQLRLIRYRHGILSYENRLHYFAWWVEDNAKKHLVKIIDSPRPPFSAVQRLKINYMSTNYKSYDMLRHHPKRVKALKVLEDQTNGTQIRYIHKQSLRNILLLRQTIHDGDIIGIVTNKKNLDTTHLGIAIWHDDGLHMLHASSISKRVIEDTRTLYAYLSRNPKSIGIRVVRPI